jgi:rubrerythrin
VSTKPPDPAKKPQSITTENLQIAYGKSVKYQHMYALFAERAAKERLKNIALLYRAIARSEEIHATKHATLLHSRGSEAKFPEMDSLAIGTTLQTLKMALSSEEIEVESMYPNLLRTAQLEKDTAAIEQFSNTKDADARQTVLLQEAIDKGLNIQTVPYIVCTGCGYIMTSDATDECPTCHAKKSMFEKI